MRPDVEWKTDRQSVSLSLFFVLAGLMCVWGGIYDFSAALYGVLFCIGIFLALKRKKKIEVPQNVTTYGLLVLILGFGISTAVAVDQGMAVIGIFRMTVFFLFWILWCDCTQGIREKIWDLLPDAAAGVTLVSVVLYFVPLVREYLFRAGRLGGVFQYSNTYALLLLIAFVLIFFRAKRTVRDYIEILILVSGILLCGSRSVMVFAAVSVVVLAFTKRMSWKLFLVVAGITVAAGIFAGIVLDLDVQRLLKLSLHSSTLNGRFLYWRDGFAELFRHPFGLGYMGYFFRQPQFQTGNYVTKYVHNDILQFGLDGGLIAMAALCVLILSGLICKKNRGRNRWILILLALHAVFDFDLQYGFMFCILLMCMNADDAKQFVLNRNGAWCLTGIFLTVCSFFTVAFGLEQAGKSQASLKLYPFHTFALESWMAEGGSTSAADRINEKNGMLASAHEYAARNDIENGRYKDACLQVDEMIDCAGYDSYYYNQGVYYLSFCLDQAVRLNDMDSVQEILGQIQGMPERIKEKEGQATIFAYRINDKPEIELEEEIVDYIEQISGIGSSDKSHVFWEN